MKKLTIIAQDILKEEIDVPEFKNEKEFYDWMKANQNNIPDKVQRALPFNRFYYDKDELHYVVSDKEESTLKSIPSGWHQLKNTETVRSMDNGTMHKLLQDAYGINVKVVDAYITLETYNPSSDFRVKKYGVNIQAGYIHMDMTLKFV